LIGEHDASYFTVTTIQEGTWRISCFGDIAGT